MRFGTPASGEVEVFVQPTTMERPVKKFTRCSQMVSCLKQHLLYSEKRARDYLFDAIECIVNAGRDMGKPPIVSRLTREAAARARQTAESAQFDFKNWETTSKAVVNAMLGAGVLHTREGEPIAYGIASHATEVYRLGDGFRDATEGYLLEFLIVNLGDVSLRDHTALAHALFRQFDAAIPMAHLEDRVALLLAQLADRVVLGPESIYRSLGQSDPVLL